MSIKETFSWKKTKILWFSLLAMIIVAIILIFIVLKALNTYTRHGEAVVVPDVKGKTVQEAQALFINEDLTCIVTDSTYVKDQPAGIILEHNPQSGQKVKKGRVIYLTINTLSTPLQIVPDVADNSSLRQAVARIQAAGFKLDESEYINGEKDWVYGIKYKGAMLAPGEKVPTGATLRLVVGDGFREEKYKESGADPDALSLDESFF